MSIYFWLKIYIVNIYRGLHMFSLQYLWKRAVRITKKPYTPQRERSCMMWENPVIFTDYGENPMITIRYSHNLGFPKTYKIFPFENYRVSLWFTMYVTLILTHNCRNSTTELTLVHMPTWRAEVSKLKSLISCQFQYDWCKLLDVEKCAILIGVLMDIYWKDRIWI